MKKIYFSIVIASMACLAKAQTNTFPSSGNVGIGTTTPSATLNVDPQGAGGILVGNPNTASGSFTSLQLNISSKQNGFAWLQSTQSSGSLYGNLDLNPLGGNVGIGTTTPVSTLHLVGTFATSGTTANLGYSNALNTNFLANSGQMLIGWNRSYGAGETDFIANQGPGPTGGFAFYNHDNNNNETQLMWILGNGNVQIGTPPSTSSSYKLNVAGSVRANTVTVNTTGADFVFEPTYHLFPLADLKKYLDQNHHLPEIPSAKEMQTNGLNVGDNQIKLLQKVEELTLYLIEKDKEVETQKIELQVQQEEIDQLKQQMQLLIKSTNKK